MVSVSRRKNGYGNANQFSWSVISLISVSALIVAKVTNNFFFSAQTMHVNCFIELTSGMNLYLTILLRYLIIRSKLILNRIEML